MSVLAKALIATALLSLSIPANAAAVCTGTVSSIYTNGGGEVIVNGTWRGTQTAICNVERDRQGISPEICFTWLSYVSSAITESKLITVYYPGLNPGDCGTLPTYSNTPSPEYVRLNQ